MLKKETIANLANLLKLDTAAFESALTATTETDLAIPNNITVLTTEELAARDIATKKTGYSEGGLAAIEMFVKEQKKAHNLEFEGKDPAKLLESFSAKVLADAKIAPNEALKEKTSMIEQLRANITKLEQEKAETAAQVAKVRTEASILRAVPSNLKGVESDEVLASMRLKGYEFEDVEGVVVVKKAGAVVADAALKPLALKDVISSYVAERGWVDTSGGAGVPRTGRGAGSSGSGSAGAPATLSAATQEWTDSGKNTGSADFQRHIESLMKSNKDFDLNA